MLVKSMDVPMVDATAVPGVITLEPIEFKTAPVMVGLVARTTEPVPVVALKPTNS